MRMRALLALLVLLGMLPVPGCIGAGGGRADAGPTPFYLDATGGMTNLSTAEPSPGGSVILGRNGTANFTVAGVSALYYNLTDWFALNLSLVSLNLSGMEVACRLDIDYRGNGSDTRTLAFQRYTTGVALETEHALIFPAAVDHGAYAADLRNGSLRLEIARVDSSDGLLEVLCGSGENRSALSIPYGPALRADAGPDRSARVNGTVEFNASLSGSADPAATEHLWNFGNGMTGAGERASVVYKSPGNYTVTLTLRWGALEASDTAIVAVEGNRPPVADISGSGITRRSGENITFRGGGYDPDGTIVAYAWAFGDGTFAAGRNVTHSYALPGDYTLALTVTDDGGATASDSIPVHINLPPAIFNITATRSGGVWTFQAETIDPDGNITPLYNWSFGDGATSNLSRPTHTYTTAGIFTVLCRITDEYGDSASRAINVTVSNAPPRIDRISIASSVATVDEAVRFQAYATDDDKDALTYEWDFGDDTFGAGQSVVHYYKRAGTFTVTLTVSDGSAITRGTGTVTVNEGSGGLEETLLSILPCLLIFVVLTIIVIARSAAEARKRREQGGQFGGGPEPQPYGGVPDRPQTLGAPYGSYGGQYQPYGGTQYPAAAPAPPRAQRPPAAPPGVCPRCGATDVQRFPDGHAKCQNCKKIFFTG